MQPPCGWPYNASAPRAVRTAPGDYSNLGYVARTSPVAPLAQLKRTTAVVYLLRGDRANLVFDRLRVAALLPDAQVLAVPDGIVVSSMIKQCQVVVGQPRIQFADKSEQVPCRSDFCSLVVAMADVVAESNTLVYSAIGLNFDVELDVGLDKRASEVILERFIRREAFSATGYEPSGASVRIWYVAREAPHYLYIEPLANSYDATKYYAHVNIHYAVDGLRREGEWLESRMREEYEDFTRVLSGMLSAKREVNGG